MCLNRDCIRIYVRKCVCVCVCVKKSTHTHTHTHTQTHTQIHTHTHTHTRTHTHSFAYIYDLFNLFFDAVIRLTITDNHSGVCLSYLLGADLVGNRKKLTSEVSVSDLEYADDMALISDSFDALTTLLESLDSTCRLMGLSINYKKTKLLSVLLNVDIQPPAPILLHPDCEPIEVVPSFQYLGSIISNEFTSALEVSSRITKASQSFGSLNRVLWHQKKIRHTTKLSIFNSVVLSTLLYSLETAVLLELQVNRLQSFVMRCLRFILGVSLWDGQRDTSTRKAAHIQRVSSMLTQRCLRLLGHIMRMPVDRLPRQLLMCAPPHGRRSAGGQKLRWNDLVSRDLQSCSLDGEWRALTQDQSEWRNRVRIGTSKRKQMRKTAKMSRNAIMKQGTQHLSLPFTAMK